MLPSSSEYREELPESTAELTRSELGETFARLQRELKDTKKSMLVIVDGWESSGKGYLLKDLTRELDPKYYEVSVFEEASTDEGKHPYLYRFFMRTPYTGQISFLDRSFYYELLSNGDLEGEKLKHLIEDIQFVEEALVDDDTLIVKFFLHQTAAEMKASIETLEDANRQMRLGENDYKQIENYEKYYQHFSNILKQTDYPISPWDILFVAGQKNTSRKALQICINRLDLFLNTSTVREASKLPEINNESLEAVDLTKKISDEAYEKQLESLQKRAGDLLYQVYLEGKAIIVAYEGIAAAGKGGNIKSLTRHMDPRGYDVATISSPTIDELAHHYLWRFYRDFPTNGHMTVFDHSWYDRVLIERVEELTPAYRWQEAYQEIKQMEHNLVNEEYLILKYLLVINQEKQLERFEARVEAPDTHHKLTNEDWRNHEKFDDYRQAMNDMVSYTSTDEVPWKVVSGMDEKYAHVEVLKDFISRVSKYLEDE